MYEGIKDLLENLKQKGIKMAVATAKATVYVEKGLEYFGLADYFDIIMGCELDGTRGDKAEIIAHILDQLDPKRKLKVAMIGDRNYDIIGAKAHGIDSYGCLWGYGDEAELTKAGATHIISKPKELTEIYGV